MGRMLFRGWTVSRVGVFVRPRSCPGSAIRGCGAWCGRQAVNRARGLALGYGGILAALRGSMEWRSLETGPAVVVSRGAFAADSRGVCGGIAGPIWCGWSGRRCRRQEAGESGRGRVFAADASVGDWSAAALRARFGADGLGGGADGRRPVNRAEAASLPQTLRRGFVCGCTAGRWRGVGDGMDFRGR